MKLKVDNIDIKSILLSGACFRVIEEDDGSFTNILSDRVINIKQNGNELFVTSSKEDNLKEVIYNYFDLVKEGLLELKNNHLYINEDKWYISNSIIVKLLEGEIDG